MRKKFEETRRSLKKNYPAFYHPVDKTANTGAVAVTFAATVITGGATEPLFNKAMENLTGQPTLAREGGHPDFGQYGNSGQNIVVLLEHLAGALEYYLGNAAEGKVSELIELNKNVRRILEGAADNRYNEWSELVNKHQHNPITIPELVDGKIHFREFPNQNEIQEAKGPVMTQGRF